MLCLISLASWAAPPAEIPPEPDLRDESPLPAEAWPPGTTPACRVAGSLGYDFEYRHDTALEEVHGWIYQGVQLPECTDVYAALCPKIPAMEACLGTTPTRELTVSVTVIQGSLALTGSLAPETAACLQSVAQVIEPLRNACWRPFQLTTLPPRRPPAPPVPGTLPPR